MGGTTLLGPSSKTIENSVLGSLFGKRVGGTADPQVKYPPTRLAKNLLQNAVSNGFRRGSETGGVPFTPSSKTIRNSVLGSVSGQTWGGPLYLGVSWSREQPGIPQDLSKTPQDRHKTPKIPPRPPRPPQDAPKPPKDQTSHALPQDPQIGMKLFEVGSLQWGPAAGAKP